MRVQSSIFYRYAPSLDIVQYAIGDLENSLIDNVLIRPMIYGISKGFPSQNRQTYWIPNFNSLKRFGILSTTWVFPSYPILMAAGILTCYRGQIMREIRRRLEVVEGLCVYCYGMTPCWLCGVAKLSLNFDSEAVF